MNERLKRRREHIVERWKLRAQITTAVFLGVPVLVGVTGFLWRVAILAWLA